VNSFRLWAFRLALAAGGGVFIYGCSKVPGWNGIGFSVHKVKDLSANTLMLIGIFFAILANIIRR